MGIDMRKLNMQVRRRVISHKNLPVRHCVNFSLWKWRFDELRIYTIDYTCVIKEVIKDGAWIVYELNEKHSLKSISLYQKSNEAESAFISCLKENHIID